MVADRNLRKALSVLHKKSQYGLQSLRQVSKIFTNSNDASSIFESLPNALKEIFKFEHIFITQVTEDGKLKFPPSTLKSNTVNYFLKLIEGHLSNARVVIETQNNDNNNFDVKSYAIIPINFDGHVTAVILFADSEYRADLPIIVDTIKLIGDMLAQEINRRTLLEEIDKANQDKIIILDNLEEALMVCDANGTILPGCSQEAKRMFGENIEGKTLATILNYNDKAAESLNSWVNLVFKDMMDFQHVKPLGPSFYEKPSGEYIQLDFNLIRDDNGKIDRLIIKGTDKTENKNLEKLAEEEAGFAKSVMLIVKNAHEFNIFINSIRNFISQVKNLINTEEITLSSLKTIARTLHTFKGNCGIFSLTAIINLIDGIEDQIDTFFQEPKQHPKVVEFTHHIITKYEKSFETLVTRYADILNLIDNNDRLKKTVLTSDLTEVQNLIIEEHNKDSKLYQLFKKNLILEPIQTGFEAFHQLIKNQAELLNKPVSYEIGNSDIRVNTEKYEEFFSSAIHIFRNVFDHGIEHSHIREKLNKNEQANIKISFKKCSVGNQDKVIINISDDGSGVDTAKVKDQIISSQYLSTEQIDKMSEEEINQQIFSENFSTKDHIDLYSGRGIGLNAVFVEVTKLNGEIKVVSKPKKGTDFIITLPIIDS